MIRSINFRCFFKGGFIGCASAIGFLLTLLATVQTDCDGHTAADYSPAPKPAVAAGCAGGPATAKLRPFSSCPEFGSLFLNKSNPVSLCRYCELPCHAEEIDPEYKEFCLVTAEETAVFLHSSGKPGNDRQMRIHGRAANEVYHVPW